MTKTRLTYVLLIAAFLAFFLAKAHGVDGMSDGGGLL